MDKARGTRALDIFRNGDPSALCDLGRVVDRDAGFVEPRAYQPGGEADNPTSSSVDHEPPRLSVGCAQLRCGGDTGRGDDRGIVA